MNIIIIISHIYQPANAHGDGRDARAVFGSGLLDRANKSFILKYFQS